MRKLMIISDSHNSQVNLQKVALRYAEEDCDGLIHLGDVLEDVKYLEKLMQIEIQCVAGNCDFFSSHQRTMMITEGSVRLMLVHGDRHNVKRGYDVLSYAASELSAQIALFGHTHTPYAGYVGGVLLVNPGALKDGRYATLSFGKNGAVPLLKVL